MPNPQPKPEPATPANPADVPEPVPDPPPPHEPGPDHQIQDPPVFPEHDKRGKILALTGALRRYASGVAPARSPRKVGRRP
jgi:hypothetical protein